MENPSLELFLKTRNVSEAQLERYILDGIAEQLEARIRPKRAQLRIIIKNFIYTVIKDAPESDSMRRGGELAAQLGFEAGKEERLINAIARKVADNARITFSTIKRRGKRINGRIRVTAIRADYSDVFSLEESHYISEASGIDIPWLKWLLTKGPGIIIDDFGVLSINDREGDRSYSRSGKAIMLPLKSGLRNAFRITPTSLSGTEDDNWLTRALNVNRQEIINITLSYLFGKN